MRQVLDAGPLSDLPSVFCWTKYGTEGGETADAILRRKEVERRANNGVFLWGIGNAIGPSIAHLLSESDGPTVVFTPMLSRAAAKDAAPARVASWRHGIGLDGGPFDVPAQSVVTSRFSDSRRAHYALVCRSGRELIIEAGEGCPAFAADHVQNLRSGSRVGASQVTSVVRRIACAVGLVRPAYRVTFAANLVAPYLVRLTDYTEMGA